METYQEVVSKLKKHKLNRYSIEMYETKMYNIKSPSFSSEMKGTARSDIDPLNMYIERVVELQNENDSIEDMIYSIGGYESIVLFRKFILDEKLELVAEKLDKSLRHVQRLYREGIIKLIKK